MKHLFIITGLTVLSVVNSVRAIDENKLLRALAEIESGNQDDAIGPCGEISAYQLMKYNWRKHTSLPYSYASNRVIAREVARKHLRAVKADMLAARPDMTDEMLNNPFLLGIAWKYGPRGIKPLTDAKIDYGSRVSNLYGDPSLR